MLKGKRKASSVDLWCDEVIDLSSSTHVDKSHETPTSAPVAKFSKCIKYDCADTVMTLAII